MFSCNKYWWVPPPNENKGGARKGGREERPVLSYLLDVDNEQSLIHHVGLLCLNRQ